MFCILKKKVKMFTIRKHEAKYILLIDFIPFRKETNFLRVNLVGMVEK